MRLAIPAALGGGAAMLVGMAGVIAGAESSAWPPLEIAGAFLALVGFLGGTACIRCLNRGGSCASAGLPSSLTTSDADGETGGPMAYDEAGRIQGTARP